MAELSEWLELMLAEIARRQEEAQLAAEEETRRRLEASAEPQPPSALQSAAPSAHAGDANDATAPSDIIAPSARRRRSG